MPELPQIRLALQGRAIYIEISGRIVYHQYRTVPLARKAEKSLKLQLRGKTEDEANQIVDRVLGISRLK